MTSFATHGSVSAALPRPSLPHPPNVGCKNITGLSLAIIPHSSPAPIYAPLWRKAQRQWRVFRLIWFSRKSFSSSDFNILHKLCGELKQDQIPKCFYFVTDHSKNVVTIGSFLFRAVRYIHSLAEILSNIPYDTKILVAT